MVRTASATAGDVLPIAGGGRAALRVVAVTSPWLEHGEADGLEVEVAFEGCADESLNSVLDRCGATPVPPYLGRDAEASDDGAYQTAYADRAGSVAAPTAGLHFTKDHWARLGEGFEVRRVTLHVGAGTFLPARCLGRRGEILDGRREAAPQNTPPSTLAEEFTHHVGSGP